MRVIWKIIVSILNIFQEMVNIHLLVVLIYFMELKVFKEVLKIENDNPIDHAYEILLIILITLTYSIKDTLNGLVIISIERNM